MAEQSKAHAGFRNEAKTANGKSVTRKMLPPTLKEKSYAKLKKLPLQKFQQHFSSGNYYSGIEFVGCILPLLYNLLFQHM
jgi:hypothetical protein